MMLQPTLQRRAVLATCWLVCAAIGCGDDVTLIRDRSGSGQVELWELPQVGSSAGAAAPSAPSSVFIPLAKRVDMAHDAKRNLLYVSTAYGEVLRWNLETREAAGGWNLGGDLAGMDLSPDGDTLIVADKSLLASSTPRIHRIDLVSESTSTIAVSQPAVSAGTLSVAFVDAGRVLVSSASLNPTQLRMVTLADGQSEALHQVASQTLLAADPQGEVVAYVTLLVPAGTFGSYRVSDASWRESKAAVPVFAITASEAGEHYALATEKTVQLLDSQLFEDGSMTVAGNRATGLAFSPGAESIYIGWKATGLAPRSLVEAYDVASQRWIAALERLRSSRTTGANGANEATAYVSGHMRASRDRRFLFVSVDGGVIVLTLAARAPDDSPRHL